MKKKVRLALSIVLFVSLGWSGWITGTASAADSAPKIKDIIGEDTYLMDDGSVWSRIDFSRLIHTQGDVEYLTGDEREGYGINREGTLVEWNYAKGPKAVADQVGVKQASGLYWLKNDGSVWNSVGKVSKLQGISFIGYGNRAFGALSQNGDVLYQDPYNIESYQKLGTISDASSVKGIAVYFGRVALLYTNGKVVVFEASNFDDNGKIIPVTVAQDAVHISYASGNTTDVLIVTRQDGTVWTTGEYQDRWKLTNQAQGLNQIVRTAVYEDSEHFFAMSGDGGWVKYDDGQVKPVDVPGVIKLDVAVSAQKTFLGDSLKVDIQETYSNGAKLKVKADDSNVEADKPYMLKIQPNGSFKVLGVGQTTLTVTSSGLTKSVKISASPKSNLKYSKLVNGVVFLPVKPIFQAMGGTVTAAGGSITVKLGEETSLTLKTGDKKATLNGQDITLQAAPLSDKGDTLFPASILTEILDAKVQWNAKWKQADISIGEARLSVVSAETAALVKKAAQGSLVKYIGRSYWLNYFQDWDRFSKVTVTDIVPDSTGDFVIEFKSATGRTLKSYPMSSSYVTQLFADSSSFLNYDPYKRYKWSPSVWKQIKAGKVSLGMTKEQVQFSWGNPTAKSTATAAGKSIETWVYSNFDAVSFVNGKVTFILS
ncbi:copper amine oxidase N-terminal domain-containing protein [Cohnella lupini]|uniref:Copper amine oxidase-like protein n=1 Tax=Cohnella lupini TaxID=1294267 RepID=A0A3D9IC18_9BACL|nr:copper amine oxidase N-terminal domain-containing protein [Cohnella lupini]RED59221.1 copper amine oxidase-like protein [Cohnella lupini]